uniref:Uncharacterized protein At2g39920 n=1 Tax=Anthurium amnicola TaxID=1678845 RepID=A0A1D1YSC9_9ARAE
MDFVSWVFSWIAAPSSALPEDMGSHYVIESGLYMSSFAATIFIVGLVIVGVLLLTLLIALIIMLQSCQNQNAGVLQQYRNNYMYDYCNIFAFHKQLNNLEAEEFPTACKPYVDSYVNGGQYLLELNISIQVSENYFSTVTPDSFDVVLMDIDDILLTDINDRSKPPKYRNESDAAQALAQEFVRRLYMRLQIGGWSLILFTRKPENQRNGVVENLIAAGCEGWSSLIMRSGNEVPMENWEFISSRRVALHNQGFIIASVISSRMDALTGPRMGKRNFKLASRHWM